MLTSFLILTIRPETRHEVHALPQKDDMTLVGLELTSAPAVGLPPFPGVNSNSAANLVTASGRHRSPHLIFETI